MKVFITPSPNTSIVFTRLWLLPLPAWKMKDTTVTTEYYKLKQEMHSRLLSIPVMFSVPTCGQLLLLLACAACAWHVCAGLSEARFSTCSVVGCCCANKAASFPFCRLALTKRGVYLWTSLFPRTVGYHLITDLCPSPVNPNTTNNTKLHFENVTKIFSLVMLKALPIETSVSITVPECNWIDKRAHFRRGAQP